MIAASTERARDSRVNMMANTAAPGRVTLCSQIDCSPAIAIRAQLVASRAERCRIRTCHGGTAASAWLADFVLRLPGMLSLSSGQNQKPRPGQGRDQRTGDDAKAQLCRMGAIVPGEAADEETHGEADPGKQRDAIEPGPAGAFRPLAEPKPDGERRRPEDADLLAEKEAEGDAAVDSLQELARPD